MFAVSLATVFGVACSSSSSSSSTATGANCQEAGAPPDGSCGAVVAEIKKNGGSAGVCSDTTPAVASKFGKACSALGGCSQCAQCDLAACQALFDAGH